jgi:hypothetical protein
VRFDGLAVARTFLRDPPRLTPTPVPVTLVAGDFAFAVGAISAGQRFLPLTGVGEGAGATVVVEQVAVNE